MKKILLLAFIAASRISNCQVSSVDKLSFSTDIYRSSIDSNKFDLRLIFSLTPIDDVDSIYINLESSKGKQDVMVLKGKVIKTDEGYNFGVNHPSVIQNLPGPYGNGDIVFLLTEQILSSIKVASLWVKDKNGLLSKTFYTPVFQHLTSLKKKVLNEENVQIFYSNDGVRGIVSVPEGVYYEIQLISPVGKVLHNIVNESASQPHISIALSDIIRDKGLYYFVFKCCDMVINKSFLLK
ncbi:MAG TPA: hypothetical protein VF691_05250 [Cytophagaceae bacterium]|jgi:hypothetical protein